MAIVTLAIQKIIRTGLSVVRTAAGASPLLNVTDTFIWSNTGRECLHFMKSGAGACNVVIKIPGKVDGLDIAERTVVIAATSGDVVIGLFPPAFYNTPGSSMAVGFTVSDITGLTVAIEQL